MPDQNDTATPQRARKRRQGQRMSAEEKRIAQEAFLKAFASTANVRAACMKAGIDRSQVYRWQEHDENFGFRFKQATADANDMLFGEAWRRAVQGVEKPVLYRGGVVYEIDEQGKRKMITTREYSDQLLSLLLKARLPEFRDKTQIDLNTNISTVEIYKIKIPDNGRSES